TVVFAKSRIKPGVQKEGQREPRFVSAHGGFRSASICVPALIQLLKIGPQIEAPTHQHHGPLLHLNLGLGREIVKTYSFKVVVEPDEDRWHAHCPALQAYGAATWGTPKKKPTGTSTRLSK